MAIQSPYRLNTSRRGSPGLPFGWEILDATGAEVTRSLVTFRSRHEAIADGEMALKALGAGGTIFSLSGQDEPSGYK